MKSWLIYGANGTSGEMLVKSAIARGLSPTLGGRDPKTIALLGEKYRLDARVFSLESDKHVKEGLAGISLVVNCAGPFIKTTSLMIAACRTIGVSYFDITGEIAVLENIHGQAKEIAKDGITAIPGMGFDVVPTDCLAMMVKSAVPDAMLIRIGFWPRRVKYSRGTFRTALDSLGQGQIRKDGRLQTVRVFSKSWQVMVGGQEIEAYLIPWGDVATAYYSTGVTNIETYLGMPNSRKNLLAIVGKSWPVLRLPWLGGALKDVATALVAGAREHDRTAAEVWVWAEADNGQGTKKFVSAKTPDPYQLTTDCVLYGVQKYLSTDLPKGALTPAMAFGSGCLAEIPGCMIFDA